MANPGHQGLEFSRVYRDIRLNLSSRETPQGNVTMYQLADILQHSRLMTAPLP